MPLIAKILIPVLIAAVIITGGAIAWKKLSQPKIEIPDLTPSATLKANSADNSLTIPFSTPIVLSWDSKNVDNCLISGDWYSPVSNSGSQSVGKATKSANYKLACFDSNGKEISSLIAVNIDGKTIPKEFLSSVALTDLFKDFQYLWKKELCLGLKNDPDVVALQTAMFFEGVLSPQEKITGNYDDDTFQAVKKFQENYGITPQTGCVNAKTIALLNDIFYYYKYGIVQAPKPAATKRKILVYQEKIKEVKPIEAPLPIPETIPTPIPETIPTAPTPAPIINPTITDFKVNGEKTITVKKGVSVSLTWSSKDANSCDASGAWSGSKPTSNLSGESITINGYSIFRLTCYGENNRTVSKSISAKILLTKTKRTPISWNSNGPFANCRHGGRTDWYPSPPKNPDSSSCTCFTGTINQSTCNYNSFMSGGNNYSDCVFSCDIPPVDYKIEEVADQPASSPMDVLNRLLHP